MEANQRLRRVTDGQVGFLVIEADGRRRVRLDRGTHRGADVSTVPYSAGAWEPDDAPPLNEHQILRACYALDRELRLIRGEYTIPTWQDLGDRRVGWNLPHDADELRKEVFGAVQERLTGKR